MEKDYKSTLAVLSVNLLYSSILFIMQYCWGPVYREMLGQRQHRIEAQTLCIQNTGHKQ